MIDDKDPRPLDEILAEILWRIYLLKKQAKEIQDDKSITKRIIRWLKPSNK